MADIAHFDWSGLMRLGLCRLKMTPADFWALTPSELMLMLGLDGGASSMGRARLEELAQAFPDRAEIAGSGEFEGEDYG
ncbi:MAG: phage tail assembly chaperone [Rhodobacteraceae bacterium]|nr:phage tail assembly chaperone [Paracoccaceae bacterium]